MELSVDEHPIDSTADPSAINDRHLFRAKTVPKDTKEIEYSDASTSRQTLGRSKTERRKQSQRDDPASQIFDEKISDKKKIKMLNRMVTVKGDGTVAFEVPASVSTRPIDIGSDDADGETVDEEALDVTDIPPLQIVMLIVGTRGDVQPFIAIGKRLQVVSKLQCFA